MASRQSGLSTPKPETPMVERSFVCKDCQSMVYDWTGDVEPLRDRCYNCMFVMRVSHDAEQETHLRKLLDCERREPDVDRRV